MIRLYEGSGSSEIEVLGLRISDGEWLQLRANVVRLLKARKKPGAGLLDMLPWELREGTNGFMDEFCLLYARLPIERYVEAAEYEAEPAAKTAARALVSAFGELGVFVRFVAFEPDTDSSPALVAAPAIRVTAASTSRAFDDAERLLQTNGPVSALDRVHTALHGYLRELCQESGFEYTKWDAITVLWKRLRTQHQAFGGSQVHRAHVSRIAAGMAAALDALNSVRNEGSVAHANETLLTEPEAMLAINCARTFLHFVDATVRNGA